MTFDWLASDHLEAKQNWFTNLEHAPINHNNSNNKDQQQLKYFPGNCKSKKAVTVTTTITTARSKSTTRRMQSQHCKLQRLTNGCKTSGASNSLMEPPKGSRLTSTRRIGVNSNLELSNKSIRCKNILAVRSVPVLFTLICFLVIANSRCDQVGSANVEEATNENSSNKVAADEGSASDKLKLNDLAALSSKDLEVLEQQATVLKNQQHHQAHKLDPLSMLREIYLDQNSKIITMMMPESETVQKFHPNGRYGRRSVDNYAEPHTELGKLIYDNNNSNNNNNNGRQMNQPSSGHSGDASILRAILRSIGRNGEPNLTGDATSSAVGHAHSRSAPTRYGSAPTSPNDVFGSNGAQVANYQLEMNKLLKCNYTGVSNLYWCDATNGRGGEGTPVS